MKKICSKELRKLHDKCDKKINKAIRKFEKKAGWKIMEINEDIEGKGWLTILGMKFVKKK